MSGYIYYPLRQKVVIDVHQINEELRKWKHLLVLMGSKRGSAYLANIRPSLYTSSKIGSGIQQVSLYKECSIFLATHLSTSACTALRMQQVVLHQLCGCAGKDNASLRPSDSSKELSLYSCQTYSLHRIYVVSYTCVRRLLRSHISAECICRRSIQQECI